MGYRDLERNMNQLSVDERNFTCVQPEGETNSEKEGSRYQTAITEHAPLRI
jgi:hypothetical protein